MAEQRGAMRKFADVFAGFKESEIPAERDASLWSDLFDQAAGPGDVVDWDRFEIEEDRLRATIGDTRLGAVEPPGGG